VINSRSLDDLIEPARARFVQFLKACAVDPWLVGNGVTVIITSTLRDLDAQAELYAQGRTKPGKIVTNAKPGESWHNFACAGDVMPLRHGKPVWGTKGDDLEVWQTIGKVGLRCGLEWAGNWKTFKEYPHFQYTGGLTLADMRSGKVPQ
jgi:peptidoglycan L-alanyl-D-glutamate endopeptidase CwlK